MRQPETPEGGSTVNDLQDSMTGDVIAFLEARLAEHPPAGTGDPRSWITAYRDLQRALADNATRQAQLEADPAANPGEVTAAKRRGWELEDQAGAVSHVLRRHAARYSGHPGYRDEWAAPKARF